MRTEEKKTFVDYDLEVYVNDLVMKELVDKVKSSYYQLIPVLKEIKISGLTFKSLQPSYFDVLLSFISNVSSYLEYYHLTEDKINKSYNCNKAIWILPRQLMMRSVCEMVNYVYDLNLMNEYTYGNKYYCNSLFKESLSKLINFSYKLFNKEEYTKFDTEEITNLATEASEAMLIFTDQMWLFFNVLFQDISESFLNMPLSVFNLNYYIDRSVANYSKVHYRECLQLLNLKAQKHKDNPAHECTHEIWGKVSLEERDTYKRILNNTYVSHRSYSSIYNLKPSIQELQRSRELIEVFEDMSLDGVLWYYNPIVIREENEQEGAISPTEYPCLVSKAYSLINEDNFLIYCYFALRHNIIQCEMHPELKSMFNDWIENDSCKEKPNSNKTVSKFNSNSEENNLENTTVLDGTKNTSPLPGDGTIVDNEELAEWLKKNNKIIKLKISFKGKEVERDIVQMFHFIKEHGVQSIENKYEWYAVYKFLAKKGYLNNSTITKFVEQMNLWYPNATIECNVSETRLYNFLGGYDVEQWPKLKQELLTKKTSLGGARRIHALYTQLIKKHDEM